MVGKSGRPSVRSSVIYRTPRQSPLTTTPTTYYLASEKNKFVFLNE